eukprot:m.58560 g.58560  ORF g.58560 m.58560 type:complete len:330 (-) comp12880_c0_seq2:52-1041(-)
MSKPPPLHLPDGGLERLFDIAATGTFAMLQRALDEYHMPIEHVGEFLSSFSHDGMLLEDAHVLHIAALTGNVDILTNLTEPIGSQRNAGSTLVATITVHEVAAKHGNAHRLSRCSPLHLAALGGNVRVVQALVLHGANTASTALAIFADGETQHIGAIQLAPRGSAAHTCLLHGPRYQKANPYATTTTVAAARPGNGPRRASWEAVVGAATTTQPARNYVDFDRPSPVKFRRHSVSVWREVCKSCQGCRCIEKQCEECCSWRAYEKFVRPRFERFPTWCQVGPGPVVSSILALALCPFTTLWCCCTEGCPVNRCCTYVTECECLEPEDQ